MSTIPVASLTPNDRNPRTITPAALKKLSKSIERDPTFMELRPIIVDGDGVILGGNQRFAACKVLGMTELPSAWVRTAEGLTDAQRKRFVLIDNAPDGMAGEWDLDLLLADWQVPDLGDLGFDMADLAASLPTGEEVDAEPQTDRAEELRQEWGVEAGQLWALGDHRMMCGDSTKAEDVARLMGGEKAQLVHADPPYGMGKEKDGVQNDNLYADKLDAFQMSWWRAFRPHAEDNASAYIWGNSEGLWRLWYRGGLRDSERLTFRNEITWDKGSAGCGGISHMGAEGLRQYPTATERCLFFMLGEQGCNTNADNYWEGWEGIRSYLDGERKRSGLTTAQCNAICGKQNMTQSAFTKGGFRLILKEDYEKLRAACNGDAFRREHDEIKREHDEIKREHDELKREFYATRAHFNNTHDNMTDVWEFARVTGEDRHGHATPKPVPMICRAIKSSTPSGAIVAEPFLGSGSTLVAAEQLGRKCYGMEISPAYCAVVLQRFRDATGKVPTIVAP